MNMAVCPIESFWLATSASMGAIDWGTNTQDASGPLELSSKILNFQVAIHIGYTSSLPCCIYTFLILYTLRSLM